MDVVTTVSNWLPGVHQHLFISISCLLLGLSQIPRAAKGLSESVVLCLSETIYVRSPEGARYHDHNILSHVQHMLTWRRG